MWGYLEEFWDNIAESIATTTETLIQFPVDYFQSIGNAVGGVIGVFFDTTLHQINDLVLFSSFNVSRMGMVFENLSIPFTYIFYFFKNILQYALGSAGIAEITYEWSAGVLSIFNHIPHWDVFGTVLGLGFTIMGGLAIFKLLLRL